MTTERALLLGVYGMEAVGAGGALAGRSSAVDELEGRPPHKIPTIHHTTPSHPNCVNDVGPVFGRKEASRDALESQLSSSEAHYPAMLDPDEAERLVPGFAEFPSDAARGRAVHRRIDRAGHPGHGIPAHGSVVFGEADRRMGRFQLDRLIA